MFLFCFGFVVFFFFKERSDEKALQFSVTQKKLDLVKLLQFFPLNIKAQNNQAQRAVSVWG